MSLQALEFHPVGTALEREMGSVAVDDSEANGCDNSALIGTLEFSIMLFRCVCIIIIRSISCV